MTCLEICNSCNMGKRDLPDMYARSPRATGPRAEGIHIRRITSTHVTSTMYHFRHFKNLPKLTSFCFAYLYNNEYSFDYEFNSLESFFFVAEIP